MDTTLNQTDQQLVTFLQDLIRIPSWIPESDEEKSTQNENQLVEYLESWFKSNTDLEIVRQPLEFGRFNLIAKKGNPDLIFLAHTDTVPVSPNTTYPQLKAEIHDQEIWGRGATDMKSGIATMAQAISLNPSINNFWFILYADEEYDFLGMKSLIKEYGNIQPKLIVSSDGSDLSFGIGCRGLIEIRGRVIGKTGHAAMGNGLNAIDGATSALSELKEYLTKFNHPVMGSSSFNLASLVGGTQLSKEEMLSSKGYLQKTGQEGNRIADIAEFVIDIRPASPDLNATTINEFLSKYIQDQGYEYQIINVRHNLGAWFTDQDMLTEYFDILPSITDKPITVEEPGKCGYMDLQMLWGETNRPLAFIFGGGLGKTAHGPEERIPIKNLIQERDYFSKLLAKFC